MPIYQVGNVRVRKGSNGDTVVINNHSAINESIEFINKHNVTQVDVNDFDYTDLNFLSECPSIEKLSICNHFLKDLSGIYSINKLRTLAINETTTKVEFRINELKNLEELYGELPKKTVGFNELIKLKKVQLWGYKPKSKNLIEFKNIKKLSDLILTQSNLVTLEGIDGLNNLTVLQLNDLRFLKNINALTDSNTPLNDLEFGNCKSIKDFSPIQNLRELEKLKIFNCGDITSISFLKKLTKLKILSFPGTNILDENLTVCNGIDYVYYTKQTLKTKQISGGNMNLQVLTKPTIKWTERMADGDDIFTLQNIGATNKVLDTYINDIKKLGVKPKEEDILEYVKEVLIRLNELNDKYDYFIETMEREELHDFITDAARIAGLETEEDITEEWREW